MREHWKRYMIYVVLLLLIALLCGGCESADDAKNPEMTLEEYLTDEKPDANSEDENADSSEAKKDEAISKNGTKDSEDDSTDEKVWVDICGAVVNPGVYTFEREVRVCEVIDRAGGLTGNAAAASLNQAGIVEDGEQIYVPTQEEVDSGQMPGSAQDARTVTGECQGVDGRININAATKEELMTLSGIGESKADSIISYREKQGSFQNIEDIMQIEGIKEGVFNKIKDDITV